MTDIVDRLRDPDTYLNHFENAFEAADEIENLRADREKQRRLIEGLRAERDDVIRLAREAGLHFYESVWTSPLPDFPYPEGVYQDNLERFAALVAAAEREACAKVCDQVANKMEKEGEGPTGNIGWVDECSRGIRARGNDGNKS